MDAKPEGQGAEARRVCRRLHLVPAFVRVQQVVRAPAGEGQGGGDWSFALERSPVPLHDGDTADRFAGALFAYEAQVAEVAAWAAARFDVAWDAAPGGAVFIPSPVHGAPPAEKGETVAAENGTGGE